MQEIVLSTAYPVMTIQDAIERRNLMVEVVQQLMKDGSDYGVVPGTDKNKTLLKPGAEKLCTVFGLSPRFTLLKETEDWTGVEHGGEPFFYYKYRCQLWRGDALVAESEASANSWEKKYRFRSSERVCPYCEVAAIKKSKFPPRNNPMAKPGWYCFAKVGGCGAEFGADDPNITEQEVGKVPNPDIADVVNTLQKMAQKRALVGTTLIAVNASEFFTQDVEDLAIIEIYPRYTDSERVPPLESFEGQSVAVIQYASTDTTRLIGQKWSAHFNKPIKSADIAEWLKGEGIDTPLTVEGAKQALDKLTELMTQEPTPDHT